MEDKAAPRGLTTSGLRAAPIAVVMALLASLALWTAGAAAKRHKLIGRDGKIHACYRVKGKPKGMVRVVRGRRHRCHRGERRMAWRVRAPRGGRGQAGTTGPQGQAGAGGPSGSSTSSSSVEVAGLESQVTQLTQRVEALEGVLEGVGNSDLTGVVNTLSGVTKSELDEALGAVEGLTNEELTNAVAALPALEPLCTQASTLTNQVNGVASSLEGAELGGIVPVGLELLVSGLPSELSAFSCP